MDKIKVIHDVAGQTLTVWFEESSQEYICEETAEEVVLMKNKAGHIIGFEFLHYRPADKSNGLSVETTVVHANV